MKKHNIIRIILTVLLTVSMMINSFAVDETNNNTGTDSGLAKADPGDAQVVNSSIQQATTMWKISVWAAKNDKVYRRTDETLTDDYYQFGSTFWIYRKTGKYGVEFKESDYVGTQNKEEYLRGEDKSFRKGTYESLSYRIFAGEEVGFTGENDSVRVPYVPNCGSVEGYTSENIINAMNAFFKDNANTSNVLINLAAMASGYKNEGETPAYELLLKKMINDGDFIVNGNVLREDQFNQIDPFREKRDDGSFEKEASSIAYVIMYEPVIRFAMSGSSNADRYFVTASDIAALNLSGTVNFSNSVASMFYRMSPAYRKEHKVSVIDDTHISIDGKTYAPLTKNCTTPFFINLANSVYLSDSWLGFDAPNISNPRSENDDLWLIGTNIYAWYTDTMIERAGFGLRFIKSDVETLEIVKTVDFGDLEETAVDYSLFEFEITREKTGEKYYVKVDDTGKGKIELKPGKYTITEKPCNAYRFNGFESEDLDLTENDGAFEFTISGKNDIVRIRADNLKLAYKITVNYYDKYTGETIWEPCEMINLYPGNEYNLEDKKFEIIDFPGIGYRLAIVSLNGENCEDFDFCGIIENGDVRIDLFYEYENTVKIHYCDVDTKEELADAFEATFEHLSEYNVCDLVLLEISGYSRLPETTGDETSGILDNNKEIIVWYEKEEIPLVDTLEIEKIIDFGDSSENDVDYSLFEFEITKDDNGEKYFVSVDDAGKGKIELKPGNYTILEKPCNAYEFKGFESDNLDLTEKDGAFGFTVSGKNDVIKIKATNLKLAYKITVNYYDKYTGEAIWEPYVISDLSPGREYNLKDKKYEIIDFPGTEYKLGIVSINGENKDDFDFSGIIENSDVRIDLFYEYENTVKIHYCDVDTNEELVESFEASFEHFSEYDVCDLVLLEISGYSRLPETTGDETSGILDNNKEIIVWYEKEEIPLVHETGDHELETVIGLSGVILLSLGILAVISTKYYKINKRKG